MRVGHGASDQPLHKDVQGWDRHGPVSAQGGRRLLPARDDCPRAISVQIQLTDTSDRASGSAGVAGGGGAAEGGVPPRLGSLEVLPGSHRPDAGCGRPDQIQSAIDNPVAALLPIAVPPGTVTLYSSRVFHRGSANGGGRARTFCFLTLTEPDSPAPPGLIHTMERADVGAWRAGPKGLERTR